MKNQFVELIICPVDAVSIEKWLPASGTEEGVVGKDLRFVDAPVIVEGSFVERFWGRQQRAFRASGFTNKRPLPRI